ncbi:DUF3152 domain-containing protein [Streptomyces sp. NPDC046203]|uniref:DUF3152 domain-containing protein n=1 Tax=Streptomyces sp. NPDC046203 TaxID=3154602 RepID=UPI0033D22206
MGTRGRGRQQSRNTGYRGSTGSTGRRSAGNGRQRRGSRRTRRGRALPVLALVAVALVGGIGLARYQHEHTGPATAAAAEPTGDTAKDPKAADGPDTASPTPTPKPKPKPKPTPTEKKIVVPASGPGTFTTAQADGEAVGTTGTLRRYRVQVEDGVDLSAHEAAQEIQAILAHPRGWAAHGRGRFQLVSSNADFIIRIATPATADKLCLANGLDTHGELNCETTTGVVVNLKRWMTGSPNFAGPPAEYRHLLINHEVGHEIGIRTHMGCPGPGKPAPVMMQQIKGLHGCISNAYPYTEQGIYITGPAV